jgi:hypothetical protein
MNRLAMAEKIDFWIPRLARSGHDELKRAEQLRKDFVSDYLPKNIRRSAGHWPAGRPASWDLGSATSGLTLNKPPDRPSE